MQTSVRLLIAVVLLVTAIATTGSTIAGELQWQSSRKPASSAAPQGSRVRFIQPAIAGQRVDAEVRPAAHEEQQGPLFTADSVTGMRLRSVVVERGEGMEAIRSAQVPEPRGQLDAQREEEPVPLFEEIPELPFEMPPLPEDRLPFEDPEPLAPPPDVQPAVPPAFQPLLPPEFAQPLPEQVPTPTPATMEAERARAEAACERGFEELRAHTIDRVDLSIAIEGVEGTDYPFECTLDEGAWHAGRFWPQTVYLWKASGVCHKPLYFEDEQLERYGHSFTPCVQPFVSGAHFFATLPVLPYCMALEPPHECIYALGHYRPGSCAPYMCNPIPISPRAGLIQAGAVTGAVLIIP